MTHFWDTQREPMSRTSVLSLFEIVERPVLGSVNAIKVARHIASVTIADEMTEDAIDGVDLVQSITERIQRAHKVESATIGRPPDVVDEGEVRMVEMMMGGR